MILILLSVTFTLTHFKKILVFDLWTEKNNLVRFCRLAEVVTKIVATVHVTESLGSINYSELTILFQFNTAGAAYYRQHNLAERSQSKTPVVVVVVVVTPLLPRDGGTARTAIQVHVVNLIELG